jgi:hypothetical protein
MGMWRAVITACVLGHVTPPPTQHFELTSQCTQIFSKNKEHKLLRLLILQVPKFQRKLQNKLTLFLVIHDINRLETGLLAFLLCSIFCVVSPTRRPPFTPQEDSWYSFLLEAESTPGP